MRTVTGAAVLAGAADRRRRLQRRGERRPSPARDDDQRAHPGSSAPAGAASRGTSTGTGPSTRRTLRQPGVSEEVGHVVGLPGQLREPPRRRQPQRLALGELAGGEPGRVVAHDRLDRGQRRVGEHDDDASVGGGAHQAHGRDPAAHRLLGRAQVGAVEHEAAVEQQRGGVAALGPGLRAGRGDDERRAGRRPCRGRRARRGRAPTCGPAHPGTPGRAPPPYAAPPPTPRAAGRPPQRGQTQSPARRPHHAHEGSACPVVTPSGPWQCAQRAGSRQDWQAREGT